MRKRRITAPPNPGRRRRRAGGSIAVGLAALLAGCAQTVAWHRADKVPYETQNDLEACWSKANAAVPTEPVPFQQQPSFGVVPTQTGGARTSAIVVPNPGPVGVDASVLERRTQLVDQCMRERGYVPGR